MASSTLLNDMGYQHHNRLMLSESILNDVPSETLSAVSSPMDNTPASNPMILSPRTNENRRTKRVSFSTLNSVYPHDERTYVTFPYRKAFIEHIDKLQPICKKICLAKKCTIESSNLGRARRYSVKNVNDTSVDKRITLSNSFGSCKKFTKDTDSWNTNNHQFLKAPDAHLTSRLTIQQNKADSKLHLENHPQRVSPTEAMHQIRASKSCQYLSPVTNNLPQSVQFGERECRPKKSQSDLQDTSTFFWKGRDPRMMNSIDTQKITQTKPVTTIGERKQIEKNITFNNDLQPKGLSGQSEVKVSNNLSESSRKHAVLGQVDLHPQEGSCIRREGTYVIPATSNRLVTADKRCPENMATLQSYSKLASSHVTPTTMPHPDQWYLSPKPSINQQQEDNTEVKVSHIQSSNLTNESCSKDGDMIHLYRAYFPYTNLPRAFIITETNLSRHLMSNQALHQSICQLLLQGSNDGIDVKKVYISANDKIKDAKTKLEELTSANDKIKDAKNEAEELPSTIYTNKDVETEKEVSTLLNFKSKDTEKAGELTTTSSSKSKNREKAMDVSNSSSYRSNDIQKMKKISMPPKAKAAQSGYKKRSATNVQPVIGAHATLHSTQITTKVPHTAVNIPRRSKVATQGEKNSNQPSRSISNVTNKQSHVIHTAGDTNLKPKLDFNSSKDHRKLDAATSASFQRNSALSTYAKTEQKATIPGDDIKVAQTRKNESLAAESESVTRNPEDTSSAFESLIAAGLISLKATAKKDNKSKTQKVGWLKKPRSKTDWPWSENKEIFDSAQTTNKIKSEHTLVTDNSFNSNTAHRRTQIKNEIRKTETPKTKTKMEHSNSANYYLSRSSKQQHSGDQNSLVTPKPLVATPGSIVLMSYANNSENIPKYRNKSVPIPSHIYGKTKRRNIGGSKDKSTNKKKHKESSLCGASDKIPFTRTSSGLYKRVIDTDTKHGTRSLRTATIHKSKKKSEKNSKRRYRKRRKKVVSSSGLSKTDTSQSRISRPKKHHMSKEDSGLIGQTKVQKLATPKSEIQQTYRHRSSAGNISKNKTENSLTHLPNQTNLSSQTHKPSSVVKTQLSPLSAWEQNFVEKRKSTTADESKRNSRTRRQRKLRNTGKRQKDVYAGTSREMKLQDEKAYLLEKLVEFVNSIHNINKVPSNTPVTTGTVTPLEVFQF